MPAPIGFSEQLARVAYGEQQTIRKASATGQGAIANEAAPVGEFAERLKDLVKDTDQVQKVATAKAEAVADGHSNDLHGTMIAVRQADIQLRLMTTVRNKVIEAYREVMRMGA